jgi:dihydrofolate reductase
LNINIIVAIDLHNAIGKNNQLLWHLPADLKNFKALTTNKTVIMGRKTYDSIGKPLPNRTNIVITSQLNLIKEGVVVVNSLEQALEFAYKENNDIFVIGGAMIYEMALPFCNKLFITKVQTLKKDADTFFPDIDFSDWKEIQSLHFSANEKNEFDFDFIEYERVQF